MRIKKLLHGVDYDVLVGSDDVWVDNVSHNIDDIGTGDCYVLLHSDSESIEKAELAVLSGAVVIICDEDILITGAKNVIKVVDIRQAYALIAKAYHHNKCDLMKIIGVVGTNGKSTTSYLLWSCLAINKIRAGFIGTGFYMIGDVKHATDSTTPDPMQLHNILMNMHSAGVEVVVMEVSAHAIYYKKINGIAFDIGIFTNLSQDHLDFFKDMDNLKNVKKSFFLEGRSRISIINSDDSCGREIMNEIKTPYLSYSVENISNNSAEGIENNIHLENTSDDMQRDCKPEIIASNIVWEKGSSKFVIDLLGCTHDVSTKMIGVFNVYNTISAILALKLCGVRLRNILSALKDIKPLEGRVNILESGGVKYIIDYAHSPDGLEKIIKESRLITSGNVITVFGCGGDRDKSKRAVMGKVAHALSDIVIITEDNSRCEDKMSIISDIYAGISGDNSNVYLVKNRCDATLLAHSISKYNDTIILAGKGSEEYIYENGRKYQYSDKTTIEEMLGIKWI